MTINIDEKRAVDLLRRVVEFKGEDYVYDVQTDGDGDCVYTTSDRRPSCLVGYALLEAGVPMDVLYAVDHNGATIHDPETDEREALGDTGIDGAALPLYLAENDVVLTNGAVGVLGAAQRAQDNGGTWGEALRRAESVAL